jgi:predicted metal-dependent enzyme (double-stranded beta helix superfamily)
MFDIDALIADCRQAVGDAQPQLAVRDVLERAMSTPDAIASALPPTRAELVPLYASPELSVLKVVWAPGMRIRAHNHLMWAAIGMYGGQEDNAFYRRLDGGITESGGRQLRVGDVALLGDDTIHAVTNPLAEYAMAIHVYGGDITSSTGRSEWDEESAKELPYDFDRNRRVFESFNVPEGAAEVAGGGN